SSTGLRLRPDFFLARGTPAWISDSPSLVSAFFVIRRSLRRLASYLRLRSGMTFRGNAPLDPSQVEDQRGRGGSGGGLGGPVVVGGGGLGLIILIIALLLGVNPLSDYSGTNPSIDGAPSVQDCQTGADANKRDDWRIVGFVD